MSRMRYWIWAKSRSASPAEKLASDPAPDPAGSRQAVVHNTHEKDRREGQDHREQESQTTQSEYRQEIAHHGDQHVCQSEGHAQTKEVLAPAVALVHVPEPGELHAEQHEERQGGRRRNGQPMPCWDHFRQRRVW